MTFIGHTYQDTRTCGERSEWIAAAHVRLLARMANELVGRIEQAREQGSPPTVHLAALASLLHAEARRHTRDAGLLAVCPFTGYAMIEVTAGTRAEWTERWTCPVCSTTHEALQAKGEVG